MGSSGFINTSQGVVLTSQVALSLARGKKRANDLKKSAEYLRIAKRQVESERKKQIDRINRQRSQNCVFVDGQSWQEWSLMSMLGNAGL